jgi:multiple antibiotic resistance protein
MDWALLSSFTLAMVAISNPLGKLPPWIQAIGKSEERVQTGTALMLVGTAAIILVGFLWGGRPILQFFQIDLSSFRMAGGTILIVIGFDLLRGRTGTEQENPDAQEKDIKKKVKRRFHHLVVPMAIPLIAGPGSIVTVTIYGFRMQEHLGMRLAATGILLVLLLGIALLMIYARQIDRMVGQSILMVQGRLFGMILIAIGWQMLSEGLGQAFPELVGPGTQESSVADDLRKNQDAGQ